MKTKQKEFKKRNPVVLQIIKQGWGSGVHIKTTKTLRRDLKQKLKQELKKVDYE